MWRKEILGGNWKAQNKKKRIAEQSSKRPKRSREVDNEITSASEDEDAVRPTVEEDDFFETPEDKKKRIAKKMLSEMG
jgi:hypothetical protein